MAKDYLASNARERTTEKQQRGVILSGAKDLSQAD
jgi:hypothetical protein